MAKWGVTFSLHEYTTPGEYNVDKSLHNQARLGDPVDEKVVARYAEDMKVGDSFPAVVAYRDTDNQLVSIDGNHRLVAATRVNYELACYVIAGTKASVLSAMTMEANAKHGKQLTLADRIHHAVWMVDSGMTIPQAAQRMSLTKSQLDRVIGEKNANRRADLVGITPAQWESIPSTTRIRLAGIATDEGFKAAVLLIRDTGLMTDDINALVSELNETKSSARQESIVSRWREERSDQVAAQRLGSAPKKGQHQSPKVRVMSALGMISSWPADELIAPTFSDLELTEVDRKLESAIDRLTKLRSQLNVQQ